MPASGSKIGLMGQSSMTRLAPWRTKTKCRNNPLSGAISLRESRRCTTQEIQLMRDVNKLGSFDLPVSVERPLPHCGRV
jgi:hypothetical protein